MYQLHIANKNYSSWSLRPWLLMQQLNIPFLEHFHYFADENWQAFRIFSPTGKVPCLIDNNVVVWDSLAIMEYLAEQHPQVWPQHHAERAWARSAAAEMHAGFAVLREQCSMNCSIRAQLKQVSVALQKEMSRIDELWSEGLNRFAGEFLAGDDFTAVDAFYAPVAIRIKAYELTMSQPVLDYVERILAAQTMKKMQRQYQPVSK
jgi:glutathione S-transferase